MSRRRGLIIGGLVIIGVVGLVYGLSSMEPTDLLARSKVVAENPGLGKSWDYFWLSDHEFEAYQYGSKTATASIQDISTGNTKFDSVLMKELQEANWHAQDVTCAFSPNGKNLLIEGSSDCVFSGGLLLCVLPGYAQNSLAWIDDTHWVGMENEPTSTAVKERICAVDGTEKEFTASSFSCSGNQRAVLMGASTTGGIIVAQLQFDVMTHSVDVSTCLPAPHASAIAHHVELPPSTYLDTSEFLGLPMASPDGRHIVWPLSVGGANPLDHQRWFRETILRLHIRQSSPRAALWVSDVDGSHMHLIGTYGDPNVEDDIDGLRWMPDSKHLSFQGPGQKLYVVDALG